MAEMDWANIKAVRLTVSDWNVLYTILTTTFAWFVVYSISTFLFPKKTSIWHCRMLSMVHAVVICLVIGAITDAIDHPWPLENAGSTSTDEEILVHIISLGYFLSESILTIRNNDKERKTTSMIVHHIFTITGMATFIYMGRSGSEGCTLIFGSEITNPLVMLRWFLRDANCKRIYMLPLEISFTMIYVIFRIGFGTYFMYCLYGNPKVPLYAYFFSVAGYLISLAFFIEIMLYFARKVVFKTVKSK